MNHIQKAHELSNKILAMCSPLVYAQLNPGIVAHALIYAGVRLALTFSLELAPYITKPVASAAFGELMDEINELMHKKMIKLGVPVRNIDATKDISEPSDNPFYGN